MITFGFIVFVFFVYLCGPRDFSLVVEYDLSTSL